MLDLGNSTKYKHGTYHDKNLKMNSKTDKTKRLAISVTKYSKQFFFFIYWDTPGGRNKTLSNQAFERVKYITIVNSSDIFGKNFLTSNFYSREYYTANATASDLSNKCVLILVKKIYTTEYKHLLGIYAVVNQVTLRPMEMTDMFDSYDSYLRWLG